MIVSIFKPTSGDLDCTYYASITQLLKYFVSYKDSWSILVIWLDASDIMRRSFLYFLNKFGQLTLELRADTYKSGRGYRPSPFISSIVMHIWNKQQGQ